MSAALPGIDCVVFDLGGVVVRIARSWAGRCAQAGLPVRDAARCEEAVRRHRAQIAALQVGRTTAAEVAAGLAADMAGAYTAAEVHKALNRQLLGAHPGVAELSARLMCPHAIFSNTSADHWRVLRRCEVVRTARRAFTSFELGLAKPAPAAYEAVRQGLGVPADRLLFFDDGEVNVRAAREAGWHAVRIDPTRPVAPQLEASLGRYRLLAPAS